MISRQLLSSRLGVFGLVVAIVCMVALWAMFQDTDDEKDTAVQDGEKSEQVADAATQSLESLCDAGVQTACDQLEGIKNQPDPDDPEQQELEIQDPEVQEPEAQQPEVQDPERDDVDPDDPEVQQPEQQDPETQDPDSDDPDNDDAEKQDDEVQDTEVNDPDPDDPEKQDEEIQDPEVDDPDPNVLLEFRASNSCSPPAGEFITSIGFTVVRDEGSVTYVLTCTSAVPAPADLPPLSSMLRR